MLQVLSVPVQRVQWRSRRKDLSTAGRVDADGHCALGAVQSDGGVEQKIPRSGPLHRAFHRVKVGLPAAIARGTRFNQLGAWNLIDFDVQLQILSTSPTDRRKKILSSFWQMKTRFVSVRDAKKTHSMWGLKMCYPPALPAKLSAKASAVWKAWASGQDVDIAPL